MPVGHVDYHYDKPANVSDHDGVLGACHNHRSAAARVAHHGLYGPRWHSGHYRAWCGLHDDHSAAGDHDSREHHDFDRSAATVEHHDDDSPAGRVVAVGDGHRAWWC